MSRCTPIPANGIILLFLYLSSTPLYVICTTSSLSIPLSMDIWVASVSWLLKYCFSGYWGVCILSDYAFLWTYAQEWISDYGFLWMYAQEWISDYGFLWMYAQEWDCWTM